jgi:hypothetical protein
MISAWLIEVRLRFKGSDEDHALRELCMHASSTYVHSETRASAPIGIIPAEGGWTVSHNNRILYVTALICNVQTGLRSPQPL